MATTASRTLSFSSRWRRMRAVARLAKRSTAAAPSSSLPPGKRKYIDPFGASASAMTWLSPVAAYPCVRRRRLVARTKRSRVSDATPASYQYGDWSIDYDDWSSYRRVMEMPTGMTIRPSAPGDGPALHALVDRCSAGTLVRRFHGGGVGPAHREMDRVAQHAATHRSWVAEADGEIHGAGTLAWAGPDEARAEVAFLVEDAWFRRGVGRGLYAAIAAEARREGIAVSASVQADNERAIRFLVGVAPGARPRYAGDGLVEVTFPPAPAVVPSAPAVAAVASTPRRKAA